MLAQMPQVKSATNARANERRRHHDDILKKILKVSSSSLMQLAHRTASSRDHCYVF
jgi:hypothetical protein